MSIFKNSLHGFNDAKEAVEKRNHMYLQRGQQDQQIHITERGREK